ncbi:MAG: ATP-binding cassette domain-containing protein [Pseudomonadota bacterium]
MSCLSARGLVVAFDGGAPLRLPDVDLEAGGCIALHGPSGSGKTTLLRVVAGLLPYRSGSLRNGFLRIGFAFQDNRLIPHLSARQNVLFCAPRTSPFMVPGAVDAAFDALGVANRADHRATQLSGGEAQRVNLLRALSVRPDLLLLDEIGANTDDKTWGRIAAYLGAVRAEHQTAVVQIAHNPLRCLEPHSRIEF